MVFLFAAGAKGFDIVRFGRQIEALTTTVGIEQTTLLAAIALTFAICVVILELFLGASLLTGYNSTHSSMLAVGVLITFASVAVWVIMGGSKFDCGCFGTVTTRTPTETLGEDLLLIIMAIIGTTCKLNSLKGRVAMRVIVIAGVLWTGSFYFFPHVRASLREGSIVSRNVLSSYGVPPATRYIWVFNPDCSICQTLTPAINLIAASSPKCLVGISAAATGKIDEFAYDFKPTFPMHEIPSSKIGEFDLQDGTLIRLSNGKVDRVWPPYLLRQITLIKIAT